MADLNCVAVTRCGSIRSTPIHQYESSFRLQSIAQATSSSRHTRFDQDENEQLTPEID